MQNQENVNRKSFPSPMGNEVGLMVSGLALGASAVASFRPLWGMRWA